MKKGFGYIYCIVKEKSHKRNRVSLAKYDKIFAEYYKKRKIGKYVGIMSEGIVSSKEEKGASFATPVNLCRK